MNTISSAPMGMMERLKTAAGVVTSGRVPNPLAQEPKNRSRGALVQELNEWCLETREFWKPVFDRIIEEQEFAAGKQWPEGYKCADDEAEPFMADRIQQMLNRMTASTYAKNPTPEAKQVERMVFEVWDGTMESYNGAKAIWDAAQPILREVEAARIMGREVEPPPPELEFAKEIVEDYERGQARKAMNAKIARTYTLLIQEQWRTQSPEFLASMKQLVTQIYAARVGFVKVMYRRPEVPGAEGQVSGKTNPMVAEQANLPVDQIAALKARLEQMLEPGFDPDGPEAEETRLLMESLARKQGAAGTVPGAEGQVSGGDGEDDEGVVYDFLGPLSVLLDPRCTNLREFVGARRIAHEMVKPVEEVEREYKVSLRDCGAVVYVNGAREQVPGAEGQVSGEEESEERGCVCVWIIEDKGTGLCYAVCDGVKDFLCEPYEPEPALTRFWDIVAITFNAQSVTKNDPKKDVTCYPRSHVRLAMPMQVNINKKGEGYREHCEAARPYKVGVKSKFDDVDLRKLAGRRAANDVILLNDLQQGDSINDYFQDGPVPKFSPELYATGPDDQALMLATGAQPANLGAQNPDETATGQSIAEGSRISVDNSNSGELDYGLSTLAQMTFEMLLTMPVEAVKRRIGPGAMVPELSKDEVRHEMFFQIEAGSSGRPNQAQEISNLKILGPMLADLMERHGKDPEPLIKHIARTLNANVDVDEFLKPAQVQPGPQQIAPVGPVSGAGGQGSGGAGAGPLPAGLAAPNVGPGARGQVSGVQAPPPMPPVSRNQVAATANG